MNAAATFSEILDHLAPRLDAAELALYLYCIRHSHLQGKSELTVGLGSAVHRLPLGIGNPGHPMCEQTAMRKLRSLVSKGCVEILEVHRRGHRLRVALPADIPGVIPPPAQEPPPSLETMDFFEDPACPEHIRSERRLAILARENYQCFYCRRAMDSTNFLIEHVVSRPAGNNSYSNLVAACHACNTRKSNSPADEFLRQLYREGFLTQDDFSARISALQALKRGLLKPAV